MIRKRFILSAVGLASLLMPLAAQAVEPVFSGGAKLWYAEPKLTDRAFMYGVTGMGEWGDDFWVSAHYLRGEFDFVERVRPQRVKRVALQEGEVLAGRSVDIFRVGLGVRWLSVPKEEDNPESERKRLRRPEAYGPVLHGVASQSFEEWPWGFTGTGWGWYAGGSVMAYDFSDHDGEHFVVMAGLSHYAHHLHKTIGYRFLKYFDHDQMEGFTAALRFEF